VPLLEDSESYTVEIYNGASVVRTLTATDESVTYEKADQIEDFSELQEELTVCIYQISAAIGQGFKKFVKLILNIPPSVSSYYGKFDLAKYEYEEKSITLADSPLAVDFKSDGTKMYVLTADGGGGRTLTQYSLSIAWDVGTASSDGVTLSGQDEEKDFQFSSDGIKLFMINRLHNLYEYDLTSAWDLSTASLSVTLDLSTITSGGWSNAHIDQIDGFRFNGDGTAFYLLGSSTDCVTFYTLASAWSIATTEAHNGNYVNLEDLGLRYVAGLHCVDMDGYSYGYVMDMAKIQQLDRPSWTSRCTLSGVRDLTNTPVDFYAAPNGHRAHMVALTEKTIYQFANPAYAPE
jgi:hypothetical protein